MTEDNLLYYGDNLDVLRRHVSTQSVDLVYLDPPFNSKAREQAGMGVLISYEEPSTGMRAEAAEAGSYVHLGAVILASNFGQSGSFSAARASITRTSPHQRHTPTRRSCPQDGSRGNGVVRPCGRATSTLRLGQVRPPVEGQTRLGDLNDSPE